MVFGSLEVTETEEWMEERLVISVKRLVGFFFLPVYHSTNKNSTVTTPVTPHPTTTQNHHVSYTSTPAFPVICSISIIVSLALHSTYSVKITVIFGAMDFDRELTASSWREICLLEGEKFSWGKM